MAIETKKFSEFVDAGDLEPNQETVGVNAGVNSQYNNPFPLLPPGTTGSRPAIAASMYYRLRFNTTIASYEYYSPVTASWIQIEDSGDLVDGPFVIYKAAPDLGAAFNLGTLTSGLLKQVVTLGVSTPEIAILDTDYYGPGMTGFLRFPAGVRDNLGLNIVTFATVGSAVNYMEISNNATGNNPALVAFGSDANVGITFLAKNMGAFPFQTTATSNQIIVESGPSYQHVTNLSFPSTAVNRTILFPDADGTIALTSGASGIVNPGLINQLGYYAAAGSTISGLTGVNQSALTTNGSGALTWVPMIAGQILIGTTAGAPVAAAINSGTNITVANGSGTITVNLSGVVAPTLGGTGVNNGSNTLTLAGTLATIGAFASTFTMTGATNVTFPTSGTLATTAGTVSSVSGTANRITSTGGTTPVIDISASYVGQSSITTLGTIATGVWQGTVVGPTYGGTGVNNGSNTLTLAGTLATIGGFASSFTMTGVTAVTFPTSGTLATTSQLVTPAALTKTDDTNVTLTLGGSPATALVNAASLTLGWTGQLAITRGGTGVSSVTTAPTASAWAGWDANSNMSANNFLGGFATTVSAGGATTLTVASAANQEITGTLTQTIQLPVATTLIAGTTYKIINNSSGAVTVNSSGGNAILVMAANTTAFFTLVLASGTSAASWNSSYIFDLGGGVTSITGTANQVIASASTGNVTLSLPQSIATSSSPQFTNLTLTGASILDVNGNVVLRFNAIGSAVNFLGIYNNAAGGPAVLVAQGASTDIGLQFTAQGAGTFPFQTTAVTNQMVIQTGAGYQHTTNWAYPSTAANRTVILPDQDGTVGLYTKASFTPVLVSTGGGTATYSIQSGNYSLIAGRIFFNLAITISANTFGAGTLTITTSLPVNAAQLSPVTLYANQLGATATPSLMGLIGSGSTTINLFTFLTGTTTAMTVSQLTAATQFFISGSYDF